MEYFEYLEDPHENMGLMVDELRKEVLKTGLGASDDYRLDVQWVCDMEFLYGETT